jgi:hypothetical protein
MAGSLRTIEFVCFVFQLKEILDVISTLLVRYFGLVLQLKLKNVEGLWNAQ